MSYKTLSIQTMVELSRRWLETHLTTLQQIPQIKGILPNMERAYQGVFRLTKPAPAVPAGVIKISEEQKGLDQRHDLLLDGGYTLIEVCKTLFPEEAASLTVIQEHLYPDGLSGKMRSYTDEAGEATLLERRLSDQERERLKKISINKDGITYSLFDLVSEQIKCAKKIGALEEQKNTLLREASQADTPTRADSANARNLWIRTTRLLEGNLSLAVDNQDISAKTKEDLLSDLYKEIKKTAEPPTEEKPEEPKPPTVATD